MLPILQALKSVFLFLERPTAPWIIVFLATVLLLFAPHTFLAFFSADTFASQYQELIGTICLISVVVLLVKTMVGLWTFAKPSIKQQIALRKKRRLLYDLTEAEKSVLRPFIRDKKRTNWGYHNGTIVRLLDKRIMRQVNHDWGDQEVIWEWLIEDWAWEYLQRHPELLEKINS